MYLYEVHFFLPKSQILVLILVEPLFAQNWLQDRRKDSLFLSVPYILLVSFYRIRPYSKLAVREFLTYFLNFLNFSDEKEI